MPEKSKLKDLDKDHPFFSEEAIKKWKERVKELAEEEKKGSERRDQ